VYRRENLLPLRSSNPEPSIPWQVAVPITRLRVRYACAYNIKMDILILECECAGRILVAQVRDRRWVMNTVLQVVSVMARKSFGCSLFGKYSMILGVVSLVRQIHNWACILAGSDLKGLFPSVSLFTCLSSGAFYQLNNSHRRLLIKWLQIMNLLNKTRNEGPWTVFSYFSNICLE
jgi:hypothetical protein